MISDVLIYYYAYYFYRQQKQANPNKSKSMILSEFNAALVENEVLIFDMPEISLDEIKDYADYKFKGFLGGVFTTYSYQQKKFKQELDDSIRRLQSELNNTSLTEESFRKVLPRLKFLFYKCALLPSFNHEIFKFAYEVLILRAILSKNIWLIEYVINSLVFLRNSQLSTQPDLKLLFGLTKDARFSQAQNLNLTQPIRPTQLAHAINLNDISRQSARGRIMARRQRLGHSSLQQVHMTSAVLLRSQENLLTPGSPGSPRIPRLSRSNPLVRITDMPIEPSRPVRSIRPTWPSAPSRVNIFLSDYINAACGVDSADLVLGRKLLSKAQILPQATYIQQDYKCRELAVAAFWLRGNEIEYAKAQRQCDSIRSARFSRSSICIETTESVVTNGSSELHDIFYMLKILNPIWYTENYYQQRRIVEDFIKSRNEPELAYYLFNKLKHNFLTPSLVREILLNYLALRQDYGFYQAIARLKEQYKEYIEPEYIINKSDRLANLEDESLSLDRELDCQVLRQQLAAYIKEGNREEVAKCKEQIKKRRAKLVAKKLSDNSCVLSMKYFIQFDEVNYTRPESDFEGIVSLFIFEDLDLECVDKSFYGCLENIYDLESFGEHASFQVRANRDIKDPTDRTTVCEVPVDRRDLTVVPTEQLVSPRCDADSLKIFINLRRLQQTSLLFNVSNDWFEYKKINCLNNLDVALLEPKYFMYIERLNIANIKLSDIKFINNYFKSHGRLPIEVTEYALNDCRCNLSQTEITINALKMFDHYDEEISGSHMQDVQNDSKTMRVGDRLDARTEVLDEMEYILEQIAKDVDALLREEEYESGPTRTQVAPSLRRAFTLQPLRHIRYSQKLSGQEKSTEVADGFKSYVDIYSEPETTPCSVYVSDSLSGLSSCLSTHSSLSSPSSTFTLGSDFSESSESSVGTPSILSLSTSSPIASPAYRASMGLSSSTSSDISSDLSVRPLLRRRSQIQVPAAAALQEYEFGTSSVPRRRRWTLPGTRISNKVHPLET